MKISIFNNKNRAIFGIYLNIGSGFTLYRFYSNVSFLPGYNLINDSIKILDFLCSGFTQLQITFLHFNLTSFSCKHIFNKLAGTLAINESPLYLTYKKRLLLYKNILS